MKDLILNSLSDIVDKDSLCSKSGKVRLEFDSDKSALISLALPEPNDPSYFYLMGCLTTFIASAAPEIKNPEDRIHRAGDIFAKGGEGPCITNFKNGKMGISYDRASYVYHVHIVRE